MGRGGGAEKKKRGKKSEPLHYPAVYVTGPDLNCPLKRHEERARISKVKESGGKPQEVNLGKRGSICN